MGWLTRPIVISNQMKRDDKFKKWLESQGFVVSKMVFTYPSIFVDDVNKKFAFGNKQKIYNYSDLIDFGDEKITSTYTEKQKGSTGKAIVGGLAFGTTGAVIGANMKKAPVTKSLTKTETHVLINDLDNSKITFHYGNQEYTDGKRVLKSQKINEVEGTLGYIKANA